MSYFAFLTNIVFGSGAFVSFLAIISDIGMLSRPKFFCIDEMEDKDLIHRKVEELNDISRPYAERIMDEAVSGAMKGQKI